MWLFWLLGWYQKKKGNTNKIVINSIKTNQLMKLNKYLDDLEIIIKVQLSLCYLVLILCYLNYDALENCFYETLKSIISNKINAIK